MLVIADTSFLIRLLNERDPLHLQALQYFKYLLDQEHTILLSTIAISEYCVRGKFEELPLSNLSIIPFDERHAIRAGEFAKAVFDAKILVSDRKIIPNDCNLFAQADVEQAAWYLTSDSRAKAMYDLLDRDFNLSFEFVDLRTPLTA